MHFARTRKGNDSPKYTHGVGPQNIEYEKTCRTANAMSVSPPCLFLWVKVMSATFTLGPGSVLNPTTPA